MFDEEPIRDKVYETGNSRGGIDKEINCSSSGDNVRKPWLVADSFSKASSLPDESRVGSMFFRGSNFV